VKNRGTMLLAALVLVGPLPAQPERRTPAEGWRYAATTLVREAGQLFTEVARDSQASPAEQREAMLGRAVLELQMQPFSAARVGSARRWLEALIAADAHDEVGLRARYFLGRIRQLQPAGDAPMEATPPEFLVLQREHPEHYLAQLAGLKMILHELYAPAAGPAVEQRLQAAEDRGQALLETGLRRDFHLALGDAYLFFGDRREPALRHLAAAVQLGITDSNVRATVLVQVGELARLAGAAEQAAESYRSFLTEFRRDPRRQVVMDRLAEVKAAAEGVR
jgi:hypothetical protein